jgi:VWFA-related protein
MRTPLACALCLASATACAQTIGSNTAPGQAQGFTLSIQSQLVVEAVTVKDKQGNFVHGLTAKDFALTEDGVPQNIRYCEHESLAQNTKSLPEEPPQGGNITIYNRLAREQIQPEPLEKDRYKDHRLLAFYFDMTTMPPADQLRALAAAETFIRTKMTSADLIALLRYQGGSVDILEDFTNDRDRLLSILETMVVGEGQGATDTTDDASSADTGAAFGQDDSEFNIFNTDRQLSALETAAKQLGRVSEKKSLLYFASGLRLNGVDNQAQLHATVDAAIKAGVTFWPIDARGLVAAAPLGDATQGSPGNQGLYTGAAALANTSNFQQSQDTLYALAGDSGGRTFFDDNDLTLGIVRAQEAVSDYYILGYYTSNTAKNGHFRRIKIGMTNGLQASLNYREGYYAEKEFARFNEADKERQLEDALMLEDPITDLTIAMEIDYFQLNRAEYFVPIVVKIPGRELALAKRGGAQQTSIDFIGEIKDTVGGFTVQNIRDHVSKKLSDATAAELAKVPIEYDTGYTLLPGRYSIKFLARDDETGRIGTFQTTFTIPNLNKVEDRVAMSSVVLSSQRVALNAALYDTEKAKERRKDEAANPLVENGARLIPSVTRVFKKGRAIYVYFQAYKQTSSPTTQPLFAFVTLYENDEPVYETQPESIVPSAQSRLGVMPLNFNLGVSALSPGKYDCQVTILDPTAHKANFWRAPIELAP